MAQRSETVSSFLLDEIGRGSFPGAQYLIGANGETIAEGAVGYAVVEPEQIPVTTETIYDLASLTKPLVTSLLVVKLYERGVVDLNAPVSNYLDEFKSGDSVKRHRPVTLKQLMTHTSGLPNWRPLYLECESPEDVPAFIARLSIESRSNGANAQLIYSDLNYALLGFLLERVAGLPLDEMAGREIFDPLGLTDTMFNPPADLKRRIAATERGQQFERANALEEMRRKTTAEAQTHSADEVSRHDFSTSPFFHFSPVDYPWREEVIWGGVHDGNAHFLGGVAGHAGLFSTAREVFRIANQFLPGSELFKPETLSLFTENLTEGFDTARSIGWILCSTKDCSGGPAMPANGIGHNGFTGTSIWMDAARRRVFILLTNRVHPKATGVDMKTIRQQFNARACRSLNKAL